MKSVVSYLLQASAILASALADEITAQSWTSAYSKATSLAEQMTLEELNNITIGYATGQGIEASLGRCIGFSGSVPRLRFPGLCFQDGPAGVRAQDGVSAFPSGVHIGASWNIDLAYERGLFMGAEYFRRGVNVALGPAIGPIGRIAKGGRNVSQAFPIDSLPRRSLTSTCLFQWEGFGSDPYLQGQLVVPSVKGLQRNVIACTKHYLLYEQAGMASRNPSVEVSVSVDDKTLHEVYLWPFEDAVRAGTGSIMCSYNRIDGRFACEDDASQNGLLKGELGSQGFIVSDWDASHSGVLSATAGLDVTMPTAPFWNNSQLVESVSNGSLPRDRLKDMAIRTLAAWYLLEHDVKLPDPGHGMIPGLTQPHTFLDVRDPASAPSILQQAQEGHVLVKNVNRALPLKKPQVLSIFGYDATTPTYGGPKTEGFDLYTWGLANVDNQLLGSAYTGGEKPATVNGTLWTGGGSGSTTPPYLSTPFEAIQQRAIEDGTQLYWDFASWKPLINPASEACLVFINALASEGWDRTGLSDTASDELVTHVADRCGNTMVFIHNAGIRLVDAWIDHPNVTAVMYAHLPGQDAGRAIASLIYGDVSPSGRLPYTVAKKEKDYGDLLEPYPRGNDTSSNATYTEGVHIDYRHFLAHNITPRYEFGYGLTYSEFVYSHLAISGDLSAPASSDLFDIAGHVSVRIANSGDVAAAEVAQLYLQLPGADTRALRGFTKTFLRPGSHETVSFPLRWKDISSWNPELKQ